MYRKYAPRFIALTKEQLQQTLFESLIQLASLQNLYSRLINIAPNEEHRGYLQYLMEEETAILHIFTDLYTRYIGPIPQYDIRNYEFSSYADGLYQAIHHEIERIRFCRERVLLYGQEEYREIYDFYYDASIRHAAHLNLATVLFNQTFGYIPPN